MCCFVCIYERKDSKDNFDCIVEEESCLLLNCEGNVHIFYLFIKGVWKPPCQNLIF